MRLIVNGAISPAFRMVKYPHSVMGIWAVVAMAMAGSGRVPYVALILEYSRSRTMVIYDLSIYISDRFINLQLLRFVHQLCGFPMNVCTGGQVRGNEYKKVFQHPDGR